MRRTAFITGITGFVGSHLAEHLLASDVQVVGMARSSEWTKGAEHLEGRIHVLSCDVTDDEALRIALRNSQPDEVYHLAGFASVPASNRDPASAWRVNFLGTQSLLTAVETAAPNARVLVASTGTLYGRPQPAELPITERSPLRPTSPYAQSKLAADLLTTRLAHDRGLHFVVARAFNHIGPRQTGEFVVAEFAARVAASELDPASGPIRCGNLDLKRDFTDVSDIVRAYRMLLAESRPGETFNVASGRSVALRTIMDHLIAAAKRPLDVEPNPDLFRADDPPVVSVSTEKLTDRTGWKAEIPLERTLSEVLEFQRRIVAPPTH